MLPFDLHVLGMPPAFNLSHDQTLQFNTSKLHLLPKSGTTWLTPSRTPTVVSGSISVL